MRVHLTYDDSGQHYSERLSNFEVKVSSNGDCIWFSFREKDGKARASFSFPPVTANQLGHGICTSAASDGVESIQFSVEAKRLKGVAAVDISLTYESEWHYHAKLLNYDVKITRTASRIIISFHRKDGTGRGHASFSLPIAKANQLGHALCTAAAVDGIESIKFSVEEAPAKAVAA